MTYIVDKNIRFRLTKQDIRCILSIMFPGRFVSLCISVLVFFLSGTVLAQEFQSNIRVDDTGISDTNQSQPSLAVDDNGYIYTVWTDERNGHPDIYFARSTDNGATFDANIKVNDDVLTATHPALAIDGSGNILVVWQDERNGNPDIYFARSADSGATFGANVRVDDTGLAIGVQSAPVIGVHQGSNSIYVVWIDERDGAKHIYSAKSVNNGASFNANIQVDDISAITPDNPALAVDDNDNLYLAWKDERNGAPDIYSTQSFNGGADFETAVQVNDTSVSSEYPTIGVDSLNNIYIAWQDKRNGNYDIYCSKSTDDGSSFSADVRVDDSGIITSAQLAPRMVVDGLDGTICIAWEDERNSNPDIYFSQSSNGGASFTLNIKIDDTGVATSSQIAPTLAIDSGTRYIYAAWADNRREAGDTDIFFALNLNEAAASGSSGLGLNSSSNCFIATAAYGTPMAQDVVVLRQFRDEYLLTSRLGRVSVDVYYAISPPIARVISRNETLRRAVRGGLSPLVGFARWMICHTDIKQGNSK